MVANKWNGIKRVTWFFKNFKEENKDTRNARKIIKIQKHIGRSFYLGQRNKYAGNLFSQNWSEKELLFSSLCWFQFCLQVTFCRLPQMGVTNESPSSYEIHKQKYSFCKAKVQFWISSNIFWDLFGENRSITYIIHSSCSFVR